MSEIVLRRIPSRIIACFDVSPWERGDISRGLQDKKAPTSVVRMWLVGLSFRERHTKCLTGASHPETPTEIRARNAIALVETLCFAVMRHPNDDLRIRPGRIGNRGRGAAQTEEFCRRGHAGREKGRPHRQRLWPGVHETQVPVLAEAVPLRWPMSPVRSPSRRVVMKARVVRHRGMRFRSAPLAKHVTYLTRDGVTRDGADARMFDARSDVVDERAFALRCVEDRHHFRFIVSPENAADMADLRAFARELMADAESDLGTRLDWVAVDHWNTDNPYHIHVLVRGQADVMAGIFVHQPRLHQPRVSLLARPKSGVTLELGIHVASRKSNLRSGKGSLTPSRWTNLDRRLRCVVPQTKAPASQNLRPGTTETADPESTPAHARPGRQSWSASARAERVAAGLLDAEARDLRTIRCANSRFGATSSRPCTAP